ncbi:MAG: protein-glutamate O-methyltransferase CheR [Firmicutes bacterium]|nr:protein-glutamate O-methyltransferase CheR [Bacillota bacterium]
MSSDEYILFCNKIKQLTGVDLSGYKERQMRRRLESLMNRRGFESFLSYYRLLAQDREALDEFLDRITINVSEFFRNCERWQVLEEKVIPELLRLRPNQTLRLWSAACSSGEEPYSLAMLMRGSFPSVRFNLLATDIDIGVLQKAQLAEYRLEQTEEIPLRFRSRYIQATGNSLQIVPEIRAAVTFQRHDLLRDPFPTGLDLIVCRNVMIYFTDIIKDQLYRKFAASLNPGGFLFVGSTEQIFRASEYGFQVYDSFFYQRLID